MPTGVLNSQQFRRNCANANFILLQLGHTSADGLHGAKAVAGSSRGIGMFGTDLVLDNEDHREKLRERVAATHGFQLYRPYSEKVAAEAIGWDYSTLKRKRRAGLVPFVDRGGGSIAYLGRDIADIILFGVKAKEQWVSTTAATFNAETGGSAPSPEEPGTSAASLKAAKSSVSASALSILTKQKNG